MGAEGAFGGMTPGDGGRGWGWAESAFGGRVTRGWGGVGGLRVPLGAVSPGDGVGEGGGGLRVPLGAVSPRDGVGGGLRVPLGSVSPMDGVAVGAGAD